MSYPTAQSVGMNTILTPLTAHLAGQSVPFAVHDAASILRLELNAAGLQWQAFAMADAEGRFVLISHVPRASLLAANGLSTWVQLISRINGRLPMGHFEWDADAALLGFRTVIPVPSDSGLSVELIEAALDAHIFAVPAIGADLQALSEPDGLALAV